MFVKVRDGKERELISAMSTFVSEERIRPARRLLLTDLNDESAICWLGLWRSREVRDRFLSSPTFHAMRGAVQVLGHLEALDEVELESVLTCPDQK